MGCTPKYHYLGFSSSWNVEPIFCWGAHDCKVTLVLWSSPGQALVCSAWIAAFPVWMVTHGDPWWPMVTLWSVRGIHPWRGRKSSRMSYKGGRAICGGGHAVMMAKHGPTALDIYTYNVWSSMIHYDQNDDPHPSHLALPVWESSPICCSPAATLDVGWRIVRSGCRAIAWGHSPFHLALSITDVWKREEEVPTAPCKYWLGTLVYFDI